MLRVMLDTNIFDRIIVIPGLADHLRSLTTGGRLDIVVTQVQEDELARMPDPAKRREVQLVPRRLIATSVFLMGFSPLGAARLGGGDAGGLSLDELAERNRVPDAVIALTVAAEAEEVEAFVTEDARLARSVMAKATTLKVWKFTEFQLRVSSGEKSADRPQG
jgi:hypothetical protein